MHLVYLFLLISFDKCTKEIPAHEHTLYQTLDSDYPITHLQGVQSGLAETLDALLC